MAWYDKDVIEITILGDDGSFAKMSGGDVDVEPYLYSQNTIGHENHNSNSQRRKRVKIVIGGSGEWWWNAEVCEGTGVKIWQN